MIVGGRGRGGSGSWTSAQFCCTRHASRGKEGTHRKVNHPLDGHEDPKRRHLARSLCVIAGSRWFRRGGEGRLGCREGSCLGPWLVFALPRSASAGETRRVHQPQHQPRSPPISAWACEWRQWQAQYARSHTGNPSPATVTIRGTRRGISRSTPVNCTGTVQFKSIFMSRTNRLDMSPQKEHPAV